PSPEPAAAAGPPTTAVVKQAEPEKPPPVVDAPISPAVDSPPPPVVVDATTKIVPAVRRQLPHADRGRRPGSLVRSVPRRWLLAAGVVAPALLIVAPGVTLAVLPGTGDRGRKAGT